MAVTAVAQETLCALRRQIARIEGVPAARLEPPADARRPQPADDGATVILRENGCAASLPEGMRMGAARVMATGIPDFDTLLGGGLPLAALSEIVAADTRDGGAAAGFALALALIAMADTGARDRLLLWIGEAEAFREAGRPYAPGLAATFGLAPRRLLFARARRLADALWIAEEAGRLPALGAVIVEIRGNPHRLDLTATRRLHRRAILAGRPVLLVRQAGMPEPTAAPVRLHVTAASAAERMVLDRPLPGSIGRPAFTITIDKSPTARPGSIAMEWNRDDQRLQSRQPPNPGLVVSPSRQRPGAAPAPRPRLADGRRAG